MRLSLVDESEHGVADLAACWMTRAIGSSTAHIPPKRSLSACITALLSSIRFRTAMAGMHG